MKRKAGKTSPCLLALLLLLSSCASAPTFSHGPKSAKDTLLVVPILIIDNKHSTLVGGEYAYQVNLENIETKKGLSFIIRSVDSAEYKFISGYPAGKYVLKDYVPIGLINAQKRQFNTTEYLVLEPGRASLFPMKIVIWKEDSKNPAYAGTVMLQFNDMDANQKTRIMKFLDSQGKLKGWN